MTTEGSTREAAATPPTTTMDWQGRTVAITGAGGFVGSHLTERLVALGADVRALLFSSEEGGGSYLAHLRRQAPANLSFYYGNICDPDFTRIVARGADIVFHFAAITSVRYSYEHPGKTIQTNLEGTRNICDAVRAAGCRRLVYVSSAVVYGPAEEGESIDEEHPVRAFNPYTASKLASDHVVESYYRSFDLPAVTTRMFNVYGPRMGQFLVIPSIITQLVEGDTLKLGDLTPVRNFTWISDMVEAYLRVAGPEEAVGQVINLGSDFAISIGDLAHKIAHLMGKEVEIQSEAARMRPKKSEIHRVVADISKARTLLGWEPQVGLDEGLRETIEWIRAGGYERERG